MIDVKQSNCNPQEPSNISQSNQGDIFTKTGDLEKPISKKAKQQKMNELNKQLQEIKATPLGVKNLPKNKAKTELIKDKNNIDIYIKSIFH
jgi:hypothetical protein